MKKVVMLLLLAAILLSARPLGAADSCAAPVATTAGQVRGEADNSACVWRGIPFAAPPVGERRWKAPAPAPAWTGVRDALKFGNMCVQSGLMSSEKSMTKVGMSEDCLYLNVWRPQKSGSFPVMVWIHGGGYTGGNGATPWYWGDRLAADKDVVLVSINYRLNIFGFLAHPALRAEDKNNSTGGYATLDQAFALQWVKENIQNFGGDPGNVTIFGESAGGWSICTLLASPAARGLFHRAILESGGCNNSHDLEVGYKNAKEVLAAAGCKEDDIACLRNLPAEKLLEIAGADMAEMRYAPCHDGYVLKAKPLDMIRQGDYAQVPFMAGFNRDEFGQAMKLNRKLRRIKPAAYESSLIETFKMPAAEARELTAMYPLSEFHNRPVEAYGRMFGAHLSLACPTWSGLDAAARKGSPTWLYRFDFDAYALGKYLGSAHAMEIPFIFNSLDRPPASFFYHRGNIKKAQPLQQVMESYWTNFARNGDPNGPGLPVWPKYDPAQDNGMVFDETIGATDIDMQQKCEFWERFSTEHHSSLEAVMKSRGKEK